MRLFAAVLAALALTSCTGGLSSDWEGDVRFKVVRIVPLEGKPSRVGLELDQDQPQGRLTTLGTEGSDLDRFPPDVKVGDLVVCKVHQHDDNGLDGVEIKTTVGPCQKA